MGEVVSDWNDDGVFKGREPNTSLKSNETHQRPYCRCCC
ncbi:hypothetical protein SynPROSU1_00950 [Synechococcus sp. PROS-U-1]|nr:hypothetical protein SynPROSU1_00950 [Synechococcus sp. PROS-U-1]